ncbi:MAG: rod shape-determining protein MreD [Sedimentisphaerales bacterium]|nr:rod shape-determining protein MreD [Sedimentisphaerales bacterium]
MRFAIVVMVVLILQVGVGSILGARLQRIVPDFLLLLAVWLAFECLDQPALIAAWILGLIKDLTSSHAPLGGYALAFGLLGLILVSMREWLFAARLLPQILCMFLGSLFVEHLVVLLCILKGSRFTESYPWLLGTLVLSATMTSGLYPYASLGLSKLHRPLGLPMRPRR